jgi:hypothetical protein
MIDRLPQNLEHITIDSNYESLAQSDFSFSNKETKGTYFETQTSDRKVT